MNHHRWLLTDKEPTLETRTPQGRVVMTAGQEFKCDVGSCVVRKRCLSGGGAVTYSKDDGKTWGPIGGKRPPCRWR